MKAVVLTVFAAVLAGLVALTVVSLAAGWWVHDATTARIHFGIGAAVVGLAVGAAGAWFAPSVWWILAVAGIIVLALYAPFLPGSAPVVDALTQLVLGLLGAAGAIMLVTKNGVRDTHG